MLDFTRQHRALQKLEFPDVLPAEQESWYTLTREQTALELKYTYAHACPLTDAEINQAVKLGECGPKAEGNNAERLSFRFKKDFTSFGSSTLPLREVPEIELALQAMLACSLKAPVVHGVKMAPLKELVSSYWTEAMSIFNECVHELEVSTCPQIMRFRQWADNLHEQPSLHGLPIDTDIRLLPTGEMKPIYLIPTGDVNHKRARFFAYPLVWDVFATAFGKQYAHCNSFYYDFPNAATIAPAAPAPHAEIE